MLNRSVTQRYPILLDTWASEIGGAVVRSLVFAERSATISGDSKKLS